MKYVFLAYADQARLDALSGSERAAFETACLAQVELLRDNGYLLWAGQNSSTTLQIQHGTLTVIDGPVIQAAAQLIGIYFIDARDLNDAIRVASTLPQTHCGSIEVRPMQALNGS